MTSKREFRDYNLLDIHIIFIILHVGTYLVNLIYDGQDLNQGSFFAKRDDYTRLCGLERKLTVADIEKIGIINLAAIAENKYIKCVREYRALGKSQLAVNCGLCRSSNLKL